MDEGLKQKSSKLQGRFTGDPSFNYESSITHRVGEGEDAQEQTTQVGVGATSALYSRFNATSKTNPQHFKPQMYTTSRAKTTSMENI